MRPADVSSEFGVIKVPGRQWRSLAKSIRAIQADLLALRYEQARELYIYLKGAGKHRRNFNWHQAYEQASVHISDPGRAIFKALFVRGGVHLSRPYAPRKSDFRVLSRADLFSFGTLMLRLDQATHILIWEIHPGRNAVEIAHADPHVNEVIGLLINLEWAKHTGGIIRRKCCTAGNTISMRFGPIGASYGIKKTKRERSQGIHPERRRGLPLL